MKWYNKAFKTMFKTKIKVTNSKMKNKGQDLYDKIFTTSRLIYNPVAFPAWLLKKSSALAWDSDRCTSEPSVNLSLADKSRNGENLFLCRFHRLRESSALFHGMRTLVCSKVKLLAVDLNIRVGGGIQDFILVYIAKHIALWTYAADSSFLLLRFGNHLGSEEVIYCCLPHFLGTSMMRKFSKLDIFPSSAKDVSSLQYLSWKLSSGSDFVISDFSFDGIKTIFKLCKLFHLLPPLVCIHKIKKIVGHKNK